MTDPSPEDLREMNLRFLVTSNRPLVCGGCGVELHADFEFTKNGLRQVAFYCECGFLNVDPRIFEDCEPATDAAGDSVEAA